MRLPDGALERFSPYIKEIRRRLLFAIALFVVSSLSGFIFYEKLIKIILSLFNFEGVNIVFTSPFQFIELAINSGLIVGMAVTFPLIIFQLLAFLRPALKKSEYSTTSRLIPISIILFILGFSFGIFIMRYVISIFHERSMAFEIGNFLDISLLLSQTLVTALLMGVGFQFPIILTLLIKLGVVSRKALASQRVVAYSVAIIFAALLPPTDLVSLALLTLPLVVLFELTLLFNKFPARR